MFGPDFALLSENFQQKKLFIQEIHSCWFGDFDEEWSLQKVDDITCEMVNDVWKQVGERCLSGHSNIKARCVVHNISESNKPLFILPHNYSTTTQAPFPFVLGQYPEGGKLKEGHHDFYVISIRICFESSSLVWHPYYRIMFSPTEESQVLFEARKWFVEIVDNSCVGGFAALAKDCEVLQEKGWNIDNVHLISQSDFARVWECGRYLYSTASPDGLLIATLTNTLLNLRT